MEEFSTGTWLILKLLFFSFSLSDFGVFGKTACYVYIYIS